MKKLSTTSKALLVSLSLIGASTVAFASTHNEENDALQATQAKVSLNQAIDLAKAKVPADMQNQLLSAKFEAEKGGIYEVEFSNGTTSQEVKINANTGAVLKTKSEKLDKKDVVEYTAFHQAKVNLAQAMSVAGQTVGGQVVGGEFEAEKGVATYDVEVVKGNQVYDVTLGANTGAVLKNQLDTADHENEGDDEGDEKAEKAHETARQVTQVTQVTQAVNAVQSA